MTAPEPTAPKPTAPKPTAADVAVRVMVDAAIAAFGLYAKIAGLFRRQPKDPTS